MPRRLFREDHLRAQLRMLRRHSPAVLGSLIASAEGLPVVSDLPAEGADDERVAARAIAMEAMAQRIAWELARGGLEQVVIGGDDGYAMVAAIDERASLVLFTDREARLAILQLEIDYALGALRRLL